MSRPAFDLLVAGRPSVDIMFSGLHAWPELGRDVDADDVGMCAGTSFNTPAAANRLGLHVGYIAMVGNDRWSRIVLDEWETEGLPTDFLRVADRPMPFVSVALNAEGDRGFVTYIGATEGGEEEFERFARDVIATAPARHLHAYAGEEPSELTAAARDRGMSVSLDGWDGPFWKSPMPLEEMLSGADIILANDGEALAMTDETDVRRAVMRLGEHCPVAVVKLGARGAIASVDGRQVEAPAEPATILDTTGAGDCFNAGFLRGWLSGLAVEHCLTLGAICGARAVQAFGGYQGCPREAELIALAASRGIEVPPEGEARG